VITQIDSSSRLYKPVTFKKKKIQFIESKYNEHENTFKMSPDDVYFGQTILKKPHRKIKNKATEMESKIGSYDMHKHQTTY